MCNYRQTIKICEENLNVYTFDRFPIQYAVIQNNLGGVYSMLVEIEDKPENRERAIKAYEEALKVFTEEEFPGVYRLIQSYLHRLTQEVIKEE